MPISKFNSVKEGFINSWNSGGISYCGYAYGGGLSGTSPTSSASSTDGLKPGDSFYFEYEPGVKIRYYNDSNTVNLTLDMTGRTESYHLYGVIYHP